MTSAGTTNADELRAWLRLSLTPGVGNETARQLLAVFGSAPAIFEQSAAVLREAASERLVGALQSEPQELKSQLDTTLAWLHSGADRCVVTLGDDHYPAALLNIADPPLMLYMLGSLVSPAADGLGLQALPCLAVVGSRNPTPQGQINAREFSRALGAAGWCVVSGLALGVDGAAHDGALLGGGHTVAVVGTGLDRVYPKKHLDLAHRIAERGLMVSEFPLGTPPLTANFPRRNRLISGLSQGTLVIEAATQSGSLITARLAAEQGKEVFAIPGSIHSPQSRGCHLLIKQGAKLVESAQDVLEELPPVPVSVTGQGETGQSANGQAPPDAQTAGHAADAGPARDEHPLLKAMGFDAVSLDTLQARSGLPTTELLAQLLELELLGMVARMPGASFVRVAQA
jgi:DNA processing protein